MGSEFYDLQKDKHSWVMNNLPLFEYFSYFRRYYRKILCVIMEDLTSRGLNPQRRSAEPTLNHSTTNQIICRYFFAYPVDPPDSLNVHFF